MAATFNRPRRCQGPKVYGAAGPCVELSDNKRRARARRQRKPQRFASRVTGGRRKPSGNYPINQGILTAGTNYVPTFNGVRKLEITTAAVV